MEVLVCLLVAGAAMGRQQAVSYQNFRASHGQGHPTYGADGSWSQRFGGAPQGLPALAKDLPVLRSFTNHHNQRFNNFPSGQTFHQSHQTHQQQPFFNSHRPQTHIHTSGPPPPPPPQINTYQSSPISYEPQNIPGNQNLINSAGPHVYQSPTVSSYGPEVTHSSPLPPQSYGNDRLPQFSDGPIHPSYNRGLINTQPPALQEQPNYPTNGPIESYEPRAHDDYPRNDGPPTPIYNDYNEGPRIESSPPSYSPEPSQPSYQPQNNGNSYVNEGSYHNYDEPKRDFGPVNREPIAPTPGPYHGPVSDLRNNNEAPISEPRPSIETRPNPDLRSNDRPPITEHRAHNEERPPALRNNNERPPSELRNFEERPHTELRSGNGPGPGPESRPPTERPLSELRSNFNERPSSPEIRFNTDSRPAERPADRPIDRPNKDKSPLSTNLRHESGRSGFGGSSFQSSFGPTSDTIKPTPQSVTSKQFKPHQPANSPLERPQGGGPNNRVSQGPSSTLGPSLANSGGPAFNRDEKKPSSDTGFTKKDEFNSDPGKSDFSEEDKSQSFESEFQSSEIGGQSFEADIPDFGSDESYFNSQEGYGSFESSGEAKGSYERPNFNSNEEKRNNFKSEGGPDFQSSSETSRGQEDGPPEPRNNQKLRHEGEGRHRIGEDKKGSIEDKKGPFSPLEKKPSGRVSGGPDKGHFPPGRPSPSPAAAKDTVPLANTFNKKVPYVAPFRPSSYNGDKFSQFVPIEKPFSNRNRGSYGAESRLDYQLQLPDKKISNFIDKYISPSSIIKNVPVNK